MGDERINGRLGAPGGLLGVPTGTTGTLGIFGAGGALSLAELVLAAAAVDSSAFELVGFEVMLP